MVIAVRARPLTWTVPLALAAVGVGALTTQDSPEAVALLGVLALIAVVIMSLEAPILPFAALAAILALASEEGVDDRLLGIAPTVYGTSLHGVTISLGLVVLLVVSLASRHDRSYPRWPGASATVLLCLIVVATASAVLFGPVMENLFIVRPLFILLLATLGGYWASYEYSVDLLLKVLVGAAGIAIFPGLYNSFTGGALSYYDSSYIYFIGLAATLVLFRAVNIGAIRIPFLLLSSLVIVLSFRRGAMLAVAVTLIVTGLVSGRSGFRTATGIAGAVVLIVELLAPGAIFNHLEQLVSYFTGSSGEDENINYRKRETVNAWLNVKDHWIWGIGPTADWIVYRTFDGRFKALGPDYLHNSYLWVWLRYSIFGLALYVAYLATPALLLIRRSAPVVSVAVGGSMLGLAIGLVTASSLTTTTRWPLITGLFVGIAVAAQAQQRAADARTA